MNKSKTLYRDAEHAKIAGVCAGLANYFGMEHWLVRILVVTAFFLLAGPFVLVAYIAAWFILEKRPRQRRAIDTSFYQQDDTLTQSRVAVKTRVWQAGEPPQQALHDISRQFSLLEQRLRQLETFVTSKEYQLRREIQRL